MAEEKQLVALAMHIPPLAGDQKEIGLRIP